ncbi:MAG: DUF3536 domain-containing protein [Anaerolineaceae bacterium]|nr:DUF3536 domain-containing protein [Anaerolineaceae bacterium]
MQNKAFCIHGHFYQPAREDPLTSNIPIEEGAAPYPNWNMRILDQCYRPNAVLQNFERISFNIGPTLMNWLIMQDASTAASIIEQDLENVRRFGTGNGMAQPYHHTILPLSGRLDKITQIRWGIADYQFRYGDRPQGMWLPETAVDDETLEVLAECGIEFTILAPWQAAGRHLDGTKPYLVQLPGGKTITVFFYNQHLSTMVSFDPGSTSNADSFLQTYAAPQVRDDDSPQFLLIASDGELYGHHQPFRDKFLSYLTTSSIRKSQFVLSYPGLWLQQHPATETIEILPKTSWSCHHDLLRWSGNCGCTPNGDWKTALRAGLQKIGALVDYEYEQEAGNYVDDVWELRHRYIEVLLGRIKLNELLIELDAKPISSEEMTILDLLLSAQVERQRMFTSCGWFFEDFDRIEPRNVVAYAAQAVWMTYLATGKDLTNEAEVLMGKVVSWRSGLRGDVVFQQHYIRAKEFYQQLLSVSQ